jgi:predicted nuclease with TOPRIM domain
MSVRASQSTVVEENRARPVSLQGSRLILNEAEGTWGHRREISDPSAPSNSGPRFEKDDKMAVPGVTPAGATWSAPPLSLPSRTRPNSEQMPRVSTAVDQPVFQRSVPTDRESRNSPAKSSRVSLKMTSSTASTSEPPGAPSTPSATAESRKLRPGSTAEIEWDRIKKLRNENWSLRSQIREMRNNLRRLQHEKSEADDILFRRLTVHGLGFGEGSLPHGQKTLVELMHDCQEVRDSYGPLEDDCNDLEDQLSGQEFELDRLEEAFYKPHPDEESIMSERPLTPVGVDDGPPYPSSVDEEEEESEYHPLVARYLSKMGDLDLLQERLEDLLDEKRTLEQERERRLRLGLSLMRGDQQWLENIPGAEEDLCEKIRILQKDLEVMKQDCLAQGLVDADGEPVGFQIHEQRSFDGEEDLNPLDQKSEYVKYPLLLPHPGVKPPTYEREITNPSERSNRTIMRESSSEPYDTTGRINDWLLQRLRGSALDVNLLARTFQALSGTINSPRHWQISVLRVWFRDATVKNRGGGLRALTDSSMTTQAPPLSSDLSDGVKNGRRPGKRLPFSQHPRSELEYDEVEIVDHPGNRKPQ